MDNDENKNNINNNEPATVPSPAPYEEELKNYNIAREEDLIENLPDTHPEPSPTKNKNTVAVTTN